jgi:hypothetical protein
MKRTPGPWTTSGRAYQESNFGGWICKVRGSDEAGFLTIAKVNSGNGRANDTPEVAEANARLIAAAPNLESALALLLEGVETAIKSGDWKVDGACDPEVAILKARAALKKARGTE